MNEALNSENDLTTEGIAKGTLGRWYAPSVIATEQTRESASFGTLTTADEVKSVVLPAGGLIAIGYKAIVKSSVNAAGKFTIFLGANQLKSVGTTVPEVTEGTTSGTNFTSAVTTPAGMGATTVGTSYVTTGQTLAHSSTTGLCYVFAEAGTYNISVQFRATSGSITAKERTLWVGVIGV